MTVSGSELLERARGLHRAGDLAQALRSYEALLAERPDDPDVVGLLGVLALQQGRHEDAEEHLQRSLSLGGGAIQMRNLNNLVVLLRETRRGDEARALLEDATPEWPSGIPAEGAERAAALSLIEALIGYGQPGKARMLLDRAIPDREGDPEALNLDGRLRLAEGDAAGAADLLESAAGLAPRDITPLIALSCAHGKLGRPDLARAAAVKVATLLPVFAFPAQPGHQATILILNPHPRSIDRPNVSLRGLHLSANFPNQLTEAMGDEYRFISVFGDLPVDALPQDLPRADVVLNNLVTAEPMNVPGRLDTVRAVVERIGLPVINHPDGVFQTTRQKIALLLEGIPNLKVPKIARYRTDLAPAEDVIAEIEREFGFPVILRHSQEHKSADYQHSETKQVAILARDAAGARAALVTLGVPEIYAVEYVPLRKKGGYFRKIRALLAEDEVICAIPGFYSEWMVAGARRQTYGMAFYRAHPETVAESTRIVLEPESVLGADCLRVLETVRDRLPLDFFGIDFDVDDQGQVVLFEANAAMNMLKHPGDPEDIALPDAPFDQIKDAFRRAVRRRIATAG